ncbi:hypothetical protein D3C80_1853770 [compost metagenome]
MLAIQVIDGATQREVVGGHFGWNGSRLVMNLIVVRGGGVCNSKGLPEGYAFRALGPRALSYTVTST